MYRLVLPPITGMTKTIKPAEHSHAITAQAKVQTSITGNFMQSIITGTTKLSEVELSEALAIVRAAGNTPVFMKDPLDYTASHRRVYDGYGGWTQGAYIPGYNQYSGFFAKLYGMSVPSEVDRPLIYIRPIANVFNAAVVNSAGDVFPATYDPLTQVATIDGNLHSGIDAAKFQNGFGASHIALGGTARIYPAEFEFEQAYRIAKFDTDLDGRSGAMLMGCGSQRDVSFEMQEVYWNTRACWMRIYLQDDPIDGGGGGN
jgi:hypothetical protein